MSTSARKQRSQTLAAVNSRRLSAGGVVGAGPSSSARKSPRIAARSSSSSSQQALFGEAEEEEEEEEEEGVEGIAEVGEAEYAKTPSFIRIQVHWVCCVRVSRQAGVHGSTEAD